MLLGAGDINFESFRSQKTRREQLICLDLWPSETQWPRLVLSMSHLSSKKVLQRDSDPKATSHQLVGSRGLGTVQGPLEHSRTCISKSGLRNH